MERKLIILILSLTVIRLSAQTPPIDTIRFRDGSLYIGQLKDSLLNGLGTMWYADSSYYEGEWKNGLKNGNGKLRFHGGDIYEGSFVNDRMEGQGTYRYNNGAIYEGSWKNNMFNGVGTLEYADGGYYSGEWKEDKREGLGIMYSAPETKIYNGIFENDEFINEQPYKEEPIYIPFRRVGTNITINYGTSSMFSMMITIDDEYNSYGFTLSANTQKKCYGERSRYFDEDGNKTVLADWDEYRNDEYEQGEFTLINLMYNRGWVITRRWDYGLSFGVSVQEKYRNCRARKDEKSCPEFDPGTAYFKNRFSKIRLSCGAYTRYTIPNSDLFDICINFGVGTEEGIYFGVGTVF